MTFTMSRIPEPTSKEFLDFKKNYDAQEKLKDEAVLRAAAAPSPALQREIALMNLEHSRLWSSPLPTLAKAITPGTDAVKRWTPWYWNHRLTVDESLPPLTQDAQTAQNRFLDFITALPERTGYKLSTAGATRLQYMTQVALLVGHVPVTPETLQESFDTLTKFDCWAADELAYSESYIAAPELEAQPEVTADAFEELNISGNAEHARLAQHIAQYLFDKDFRPIVLRWVDSLWTRFQYEVTQVEADAVKNWMQKFNKARTFGSLEQCRVAFVKAGMFPPSCYTHDDLKGICIEALPNDDRESLRIVLHGTLDSLKALMERKGISAV